MAGSATTPSKSRRALLAGALGGIGAAIASAAGRASPVGAQGETMLVGTYYTTAESATGLKNSKNDAMVFLAESMGDGIGLWGYSWSNIGIVGTSDAIDQPAILAQGAANSTGLLGLSGSTPPTRPKTGVFGYAVQDGASRGVIGESTAGQGVRGEATSGVGLFGTASSGFALRTAGRTKLSTSGVATIPAGDTSVTVTPNVNVTSGSFVLLTPRANIGSRGLWYTIQASADTFKIRMSRSRSSNTKVAWLLLG